MNVTVLWQGGVLLCAVFLLTVLGEAYLVPRLRRFAAQPILEIGPRWHLSKSGTPTLGGLGFIFAILLSTLAFLPFWLVGGGIAWQKPLFLISFGLACGAIGFLDDWKKLLGKRNKGLSAVQKFLLQLLVSALFLFFAVKGFGLSTSLALPFSEGRLEMGVFYYPFALFFLTGMINALNLTDGVDGLLSSLVGVFCGYLLLFSMRHGEELGFLCGCLLLGGVLGFLCFNAHPAKIFMGDTGSLAVGSMRVAIGFMSGTIIYVLLFGIDIIVIG